MGKRKNHLATLAGAKLTEDLYVSVWAKTMKSAAKNDLNYSKRDSIYFHLA